MTPEQQAKVAFDMARKSPDDMSKEAVAPLVIGAGMAARAALPWVARTALPWLGRGIAGFARSMVPTTMKGLGTQIAVGKGIDTAIGLASKADAGEVVKRIQPPRGF
jgi:hypothetical protein